MREFYLATKLEKTFNNFDVVIFDNSPNWNFLIQNSLTAATNIISPIGCDVESYRSLAKNIEMINNYKKDTKLQWDNFILIPTKLKNNNLSAQVEAHYRSSFPELVTAESIRSTIKGEESSFDKLSAPEHDPYSALSQDYKNVFMEIWKKIRKYDN